MLDRLQGRMKQGSTSVGLTPGHSLSGRLAIVLENSRNILQWTWRWRVPSPQVTEHELHSPAMKLSMVVVGGAYNKTHSLLSGLFLLFVVVGQSFIFGLFFGFWVVFDFCCCCCFFKKQKKGKNEIKNEEKANHTIPAINNNKQQQLKSIRDGKTEKVMIKRHYCKIGLVIFFWINFKSRRRRRNCAGIVKNGRGKLDRWTMVQRYQVLSICDVDFVNMVPRFC